MRKFIIACAAAAALSTVVVADNYSSNIHVFGGYNIADSDCVFEDAATAGVNAETFFNKNVGLRAGYERVFDADLNSAKGATIADGSTSVDINRFSLNGVVQKSTPWHKITPYILAGGGYESYEDVVTGSNGVTCGGQWFADAGVGAKVALTDRLSLRPEVRALYKEKCETIDFVPTLGLAYAFGGATRVVEKVVVKEVVKEVPVEKVVTIAAPVVDTCAVPTNYTDRCDNTYYVQVASELKCVDCDQGIKNMALINKLDAHEYNHRNVVTTNNSGTQVNRLLVGPYRCKKDAFEALCEIKKTIKCDAFVYSTKK
jgi:ribosomal protein L19